MSFWEPIESESDLKSLVERDGSGSAIALLKHSDRCSISFMAKSRLEKNPVEALDYFILNVISQRSLSNLLSQLTGERHESPQLFLFDRGKLLLCKSHMSIRPEVVVEALEKTHS